MHLLAILCGASMISMGPNFLTEANTLFCCLILSIYSLTPLLNEDLSSFLLQLMCVEFFTSLLTEMYNWNLYYFKWDSKLACSEGKVCIFKIGQSEFLAEDFRSMCKRIKPIRQ